MLGSRVVNTPLGPLLAVAGDAGLRRLDFPRGRHHATPGRGSAAPSRAVSSILTLAAQQLEEYFAGRRRAFELPLDLNGTPFQVKVWTALLRIPYGSTSTYARLARDVATASAVRAVGGANGANPIPIVVPCHRVIASDGSLCGFGGGLWRKRWLLEHEGIRIGGGNSPRLASSSAPGLFDDLLPGHH